MKLKSLIICGLAVASFTAAQAAEMSVAGTTAGAFNLPAGPFTLVASLDGLTFTGNPFANTTSGGFASLNLGNFLLTNQNADYNGDQFRLQVSFTLPTGIAPANTGVFSAQLVGLVTTTAGGVFVDFNNAPLAFTFNGGGNSGSFTLDVNDVSVQPGQTAVNVTGNLRGSQGVPDGGATVALLGMSLVGLGMVRRKLGMV